MSIVHNPQSSIIITCLARDHALVTELQQLHEINEAMRVGGVRTPGSKVKRKLSMLEASPYSSGPIKRAHVEVSPTLSVTHYHHNACCSTLDTINREVSSFQGTQMMYLGLRKVSCLWRCPQFRGVLIEEFHVCVLIGMIYMD